MLNPAPLVPFLAGLVVAWSMATGPAAATDYETVEGQLDIVWGDPPAGSKRASPTVFTLTRDDGSRLEIAISKELSAAHGGFLSWNRSRVRVHLAGESVRETAGLRPGARRAMALTLLESRASETGRGGVSGSQPWVSILCKFADIDAEPENLAFFQGMYANAFGGLDDYWRKQSYGNIDIVGSTAIDWVDLPSNQADYIPTPGSGGIGPDPGADLGSLFDDCTAAADDAVDFSNGGNGGFAGINQMFNERLDCCAWGGSQFATLDGVTKSWRVTWEPPWAYDDSAVIAHEMGHGFGLPHSNNFDDDGNPYDSPWDVMSSATGYSVADPTYGSLGKHHTAFHKNLLGWFTGPEVLTVSPGETITATIDAMALASTPNYRMARIPIPDSDDWYTVEARKSLGYDGNIVDNAVIISHVDTGRSEPAWAVDDDEPPADYGHNEGTLFRPGEVFRDAAADITITVDSATADGFVVTIGVQDSHPVFEDRFEIAAP